MTDYANMSHEELAAAADPLNRIVCRDYVILGYTPTDEEVVAAQGELDQLNAAARALNAINPHFVGALGPESGRLLAEEVAMIVNRRMQQARDA